MEIFVYIGRMEVFFYDFLIICLFCTATELFLAVLCFPIVRNMWKHRYDFDHMILTNLTRGIG